MEQQSIRQMQGTAELLRDATLATSAAVADTHAQTASVPYAVLKCIPLVRGPAGRIEAAQSHITVAVYQSIRTLTVLSVHVVTQALNALEHNSAGK